MMRIGIDYTAAVRQQAGIGRYTRNLIRTLAKYDVDSEYTLFVAGGRGRADRLSAWPPNFRERSVPISDRWLKILWQRLRLPVPIQAFTGPLDLFHSPDFVLPPVGHTPAMTCRSCVCRSSLCLDFASTWRGRSLALWAGPGTSWPIRTARAAIWSN
jgi:hypothetical protein